VIGLDYPLIMQDVNARLIATLTSVRATQIAIEPVDNYVDQAVNSMITVLQGSALGEMPDLPSAGTIIQSLGTALSTTFGAAASLIGAVFSNALLLIFIFLASIYISLSAHTYREKFLSLAPPSHKPEISILLARIERTWNAFFRGQITLMIVIGMISWLGLTILGVPGAVSLAIIAGLLELIPNLGPIIATIPAVIVALLQGSTLFSFSNLTVALLVLGFYILVQQLENSVVVPRVLGDAVELPPLVVMTGVLVGGTVGGILGALLATPIIATGREILRYVYHKLLGDDPFPPELEAPRQDLQRPQSSLRKLILERMRPGAGTVLAQPAPTDQPASGQQPPAEPASGKPLVHASAKDPGDSGAEVFPPPPA
jgi:predicted PurR-regulated permease PerM